MCIRDRFNADLVPDGPHKQVIVKLAQDMQKLGDRMHADQAKHNKDLGYIKNYLFKYKSLNKNAVANHRPNTPNTPQGSYL